MKKDLPLLDPKHVLDGFGVCKTYHDPAHLSNTVGGKEKLTFLDAVNLSIRTVDKLWLAFKTLCLPEEIRFKSCAKLMSDVQYTENYNSIVSKAFAKKDYWTVSHETTSCVIKLGVRELEQEHQRQLNIVLEEIKIWQNY